VHRQIVSTVHAVFCPVRVVLTTLVAASHSPLRDGLGT
jgi:hypothetical protein